MSNGQPDGVIVTGATGWIGRELCRALKEAGCFVLAADLAPQTGPWDRFVSIDISRDPLTSESLADELRADEKSWALIHCAGYAHRPVETPEEIERFYAINDRGTQRVVDWCKELGVDRLVYLSSIAFYDWDHASGQLPLAEEAPLNGRTAYADSKLKGEKHVLESGLDVRVVRLATVFGKGDRANFSKLAKALQANRFIIPGKGEARKSVISVNKAADWIATLTLLPEVPYRILNLGFEEAPSLRQICELFSHYCAFPSSKSVPLWLIKMLAYMGDVCSILKSNFPLTSATLKKLTHSTWVDCHRALELLPEMQHASFEEELRHAAGYYRNA